MLDVYMICVQDTLGVHYTLTVCEIHLEVCMMHCKCTGYTVSVQNTLWRIGFTIKYTVYAGTVQDILGAQDKLGVQDALEVYMTHCKVYSIHGEVYSLH